MSSMKPITGALLLAVVALAGCSGATPAAAPATTVTATVTLPAVTETVPGPAQTTITLPAVTQTVVAPPPAAVAAIEEGTWTVGTDIQPGKYRTIDAVTDGCYWMISKSGSNGDDIVANDLPTGGRPTVTLRAGQDFSTRECGSWAKAS